MILESSSALAVQKNNVLTVISLTNTRSLHLLGLRAHILSSVGGWSSVEVTVLISAVTVLNHNIAVRGAITSLKKDD